ncbi:MAG TPA: divalent-cation tolerance protein CutA [Spirochaetota bacterium]|nr:divalent-cation tolerance protein CutA [Spirochaetota bacterium]
MESFIIIFCTVPSQETGMKIADDLVSGEYAACVNIVPGLTSIYRWKGDICKDNELLLIIKSRKSLCNDIIFRIKALHPYEVPEIISCDISGGSKSYLQWLSDSTGMR